MPSPWDKIADTFIAAKKELSDLPIFRKPKPPEPVRDYPFLRREIEKQKPPFGAPETIFPVAPWIEDFLKGLGQSIRYAAPRLLKPGGQAGAIEQLRAGTYESPVPPPKNTAQMLGQTAAGFLGFGEPFEATGGPLELPMAFPPGAAVVGPVRPALTAIGQAARAGAKAVPRVPQAMERVGPFTQELGFAAKGKGPKGWEISQAAFIKRETPVLSQQTKAQGLTLSDEQLKGMAADLHKQAVQAGIMEGKVIPPHVLAPYDDLKPLAAAIQKGMAKAVRPVAPPAPPAVTTQGLDIQELRVSDIKVDPERFQFKSDTAPKTGISGKLAEVQRFDPLLGQVVYVWEDKAGIPWIVNGHQRLGLAKRTGQITLKAMVDSEVGGVTMAEARSRGALINIAEGQGTPVDVAKFLRDSGKGLEWLTSQGIAPTNRLATRGAALKNLDDGLFAKVIRGELSEDAGVVIGEGLVGDFANQREVAKLVMGARKELTARELKALIQEAKGQTVSVTQMTLFGETVEQKSTLIAKAKLRAWIEDELATDKRLFTFVTRGGRPEALARGETIVNVPRAEELVKESGTALAIFQARVNTIGPINSILRESAEEVLKGGNEKVIRGEALDRIRNTISSGIALNPEGIGVVRLGEAGGPVGLEARARVADVTHEVGPPPGTAGQFGMGLGERPAQGQLLAEFEGAGNAPALADVEMLLRKQAREAEIARGQMQMPAPAAPQVAAVRPPVVAPAPSKAAPPPSKEAFDQTIKMQIREIQGMKRLSRGDEIRLARLRATLQANPSKWQVGQGVGWRPVPGQVNRGYRIESLMPETKEAIIRPVGDIGQLADYTGEAQRVEMIDLLRDRRFDATQPQPFGVAPKAAPPPPAPAPAEAVAPAVREPWQMTKTELGQEGFLGYDTGMNKWVFRKTRKPTAVPLDDNAYRQFIEQSLNEGKPVPPEVLADYPELARAIPKPPVTPKITITSEEAMKFANPEKPYIVDEIYDKGLAVNPDGTMTLYHATTKERAEQLIRNKTFKTAEGAPDAYGVYFSTSPEVAGSYGDGTLVKVNVKLRDLNLDDAFPGRPRMDFQVNTKRGIYNPVSIEPVTPTAPGAVPEAPPVVAAVPETPPVVGPSRAAEMGGVPPAGVPPTPPVAPSIRTPTQATQRVRAIHQEGQQAPESVTPELAKEAHIELGAPDGPRSPKPPGPSKGGMGVPQEPADVLRQIAAQATGKERPDQTLFRLHEAAIGNEQRRVNIQVRDGNQKLQGLGIGAMRRGQLVPKDTDIPQLDALYYALHNPSKVASGEVAVPKGFRAIYDDLRDLTDWEEAARLDFDPKMATVQDYFFRGWKPPAVAFTPGGPLVKKPPFMKPRIDATYQEMRKLGFEPLFWNPYQQWGLSRMQGTKYREQMELVAWLKGLGDDFIRPHDGGPILLGWRVPEVGPAFEGKPFAIINRATGEPATLLTRRWIVPDGVANTLENIYGKRPDIGKLVIGGKTIDPLAIIDWLTFVPKRAKLIGSFFQQVDFLTRAGAGSWTRLADGLAAGKPIEGLRAWAKYPETVGLILRSNFSPAYRQSLARQLDSTVPLIVGRPGVHLKGISEAGLSTMDVTIFPADMDKLVRQVATETGVVKGALGAVVELESAMRRGLFEGVYRAAIITDIRNNIAPMVARFHPGLNDAQLNGTIARIANIKYSTIPASQSVIQNQVLRETLRRVFFSMGESEGLLRQAAGAIRGPETAFWRRHWLGAYLFVIATASVIHFASTGKPLPKERYIPIAKDRWGPLPFGYNTRFASPTLPLKGRGGAELTLDVVGQMDTALRVLNPAFFIEARQSVPVRSALNQISGTDFWGKRIDDVGPGGVVSRTGQLLTDLFAPIGAGGLGVEVGRRYVPGAEKMFEEGETKLGLTGLGIQATGLNIRAATREQRLISVHGEGVRETLNTLDKLGRWPASVPRKFDMRLGVKGGEIDLTSEQRETLQWLTDDAVVRKAGPLIRNPRFQTLSDEAKKEVITKVVTPARELARAQFRLSLKRGAIPAQPTPTPIPPPTPWPTPQGMPPDIQAIWDKFGRRANISMDEANRWDAWEREQTPLPIPPVRQGVPPDIQAILNKIDRRANISMDEANRLDAFEKEQGALVGAGTE